jgi:hypothetical protein
MTPSLLIVLKFQRGQSSVEYFERSCRSSLSRADENVEKVRQVIHKI